VRVYELSDPERFAGLLGLFLLYDLDDRVKLVVDESLLTVLARCKLQHLSQGDLLRGVHLLEVSTIFQLGESLSEPAIALTDALPAVEFVYDREDDH
jgi:hypothetical protein